MKNKENYTKTINIVNLFHTWQGEKHTNEATYKRI